MRVDYDSLADEIARVLSKCRLAAHQARVKALSTLLQGMLCCYVKPVYQGWGEEPP